MPRTRYLKPDFFDDEELCGLSFAHRIGYAGLWVWADKAGRLEDRPRRLKPKIFPFDDVDMEALLTDLARGGFIIRYLADGKAYIAIKPKAWAKHQRPRNDEPESEIPPPSGGVVVYATLGSEEALAQSLRRKDTAQSLPSDEPVTAERILMGMGMGTENGNEKGERVETLPRSTPDAVGTQEPVEARASLEPASPALLLFPTVGTQGLEWALTERQANEWRRSYPGLDVLAEAHKALAWVRAHPDRRKTPRGMPAFLVNWFNRAVDYRRGPTGPPMGKTAGNLGELGRFAARGQE